MSRESTLRLDREGRFWHDGERVEHRPLSRALASWVTVHPDDGRFILANGYDWTYFAVDETPMFVESIAIDERNGSVVLRTFDGKEEPLDPSTLRLAEDDVVVVRVRGGTLEARFSRHAQLALAPLLDEADPPTLRIGARRYPIERGTPSVTPRSEM
jgi:hypothetical protein